MHLHINVFSSACLYSWAITYASSLELEQELHSETLGFCSLIVKFPSHISLTLALPSGLPDTYIYSESCFSQTLPSSSLLIKSFTTYSSRTTSYLALIPHFLLPQLCTCQLLVHISYITAFFRSWRVWCVHSLFHLQNRHSQQVLFPLFTYEYLVFIYKVICSPLNKRRYEKSAEDCFASLIDFDIVL